MFFGAIPLRGGSFPSPSSLRSGYAGVPSFAFQEPIQVRLMSTEGQPCSLTIPIASIPTHPSFISMTSIHISTARRILQAPEPVDLKCWTKSGPILELHNAIPLRYNFYEGTQQFKILNSREIRTIRLNLIFELNGTEVFL